MQFSQDINTDAYVIRSYGPGEIVVSEPRRVALQDTGSELEEHAKRLQKKTLTQSAIIAVETLVEAWPPQNAGQLTSAHLVPLVALAPEVVLFGTGKKLEWPPPSVLDILAENNIGAEVMDTAAACRTYNILMLEGRRVAAALMMITP